MDVYKEQLIRVKPNSSDKMKKAIVVVMMFCLCVMAIYFSIFIVPYIPLGCILIFAIVWGGLTFMRNLDYEYEYIFTNGDLDVDKIIAKAKRKRLCTVKVSSFTNFCLYDEGVEPKSDIDASIVVTDGTDSPIYLAEFSHPDLGLCALYFSPNEDMLECIKGFLPRNLRGQI